MTPCETCGDPEHAGLCDRFSLTARIREFKKQVSDLLQENRQLRGIEAARQKITPAAGVIMVRSLISHRNQKPRVDIQIGEIHTQLEAENAIDVGRNILEVATGAYADAFIFHFMKEKIEVDDPTAVAVVQEFREYRDKLLEEFRSEEDKPDGPVI